MASRVGSGGPAFPTVEFTHADQRIPGSDGMNLRDYFAAKALQGMLAVPDAQRYGDRSDKSLTVEEWQQWCVDGLVEHAYRVADAMLKAREVAA